MKINEPNKRDDYNDVFNNLQDYMLDESNIRKSLEMKMTTNKETFKSKNEDKNIKPKSSIFVPREKDTLFWCFYIMKHGDTKYEMLEHKNILTEKKIKIEYVIIKLFVYLLKEKLNVFLYKKQK